MDSSIGDTYSICIMHFHQPPVHTQNSVKTHSTRSGFKTVSRTHVIFIIAISCNVIIVVAMLLSMLRSPFFIIRCIWTKCARVGQQAEEWPSNRLLIILLQTGLGVQTENLDL